MASVLHLVWLILINIANGSGVAYLDCESFTTELQCNEYLSEGCYWQHHIFECISISCWTFTSHQDCLLWQSKYKCYWNDNISNYLYHPIDNQNICYKYCPKLIDIVFIINLNTPQNAEIVLNYTKSIVSIFNSIYSTTTTDNNHFSLILFSYHVQEIFDLNTGWNMDEYFNILDNIFDPQGRYSLLFNNDIASDAQSLLIAKTIFQKSERYTLENNIYRKLAIYISSQNIVNAEQICQLSSNYEYDLHNIELYGIQIGHSPTFNCYGNNIKYISSYNIHSVSTYDTLYNDIDYLLSSICPSTLTPTTFPTNQPSYNPTTSPTNLWKKILITNKTCIDSSLRQSFRFNIPFNGVVSGIIFSYISGWRKEDKSPLTRASYWGSAKYNQFSIVVQNLANELVIYPVITETRNIMDCNTKYLSQNYNDLLNNYYCLFDNISSVNNTVFTLYAPTYNVNINDKWSVFYADDIYEPFHINTQKIGKVCFSVHLLYEYIDTQSPSNSPITSHPSNIPSKAPTIKPGDPTRSPSNPTTSNPTTFSPITTDPPTTNPTTSNPTTYSPTTSKPTSNPSFSPITLSPTIYPTYSPITLSPTNNPTLEPTLASTPTLEPTIQPTYYPSNIPTTNPSIIPTSTPSISPTIRLYIDCCEFLSNITYSTIHATPNEFDLMRNYSNYLLNHKSECLNDNICGYLSYSNSAINNYNKCQFYWFKILMFYEKYSIPMEAYYKYNKICYFCNNYNVYYDKINDGMCFGPEITTTTQTPSTHIPITNKPITMAPSTISPTINPSISPTVKPTVTPTVMPTELPTSIPLRISSTDLEIIIEYNTTSSNNSNNNNSSSLCSDNVNISCKNDNTLKICLWITFSVIIFNILIMFGIYCYYHKKYLSKQPDVYEGSSVQSPSDGRSYLKHASDDNMKKKNKMKHKNNAKSKGKRKRKKKNKNKKKRNNVKSKGISDVDIELQLSSED